MRWLRTVCLAALLASLPGTGGCLFSERPFPLDPDEVTRLPPPPPNVATARQWLAWAHRRLAPLLPARRTRPALTAELTDARGRPADLVRRFDVRVGRLESIFANFLGLCYSAQVTGRHNDTSVAPPWPGFDDVWVPVGEDLELSARLGLARGADGRAIDADCIVLLPGLCGGLHIQRTEDLGAALRASGFHVLAVEMRGHGQTSVRYPGVPYNWGVQATHDLLRVAEWLQRRPHVRRTGLIGFSWGANQALLAAWADGRGKTHPSVPPRLEPYLGPRPPGMHFTAGVIAFSPTLGFEKLIVEKLDVPKSYFCHPVQAGLQHTLRSWMVRKNYPEPRGPLRNVMLPRGIDYPGAQEDTWRYLRLLGRPGAPSDDKLASARVPVLIAHGADDPIVPVQRVADLLAGTPNPHVAAIVLPSGGHIGFGPYAKAWYYSLILGFFDPAAGAAACARRP